MGQFAGYIDTKVNTTTDPYGITGKLHVTFLFFCSILNGNDALKIIGDRSNLNKYPQKVAVRKQGDIKSSSLSLILMGLTVNNTS